MDIYSAYLLIFHGSRNQKYSQTIALLANLVQKQLESFDKSLFEARLSDEQIQQPKAIAKTLTYQALTPIVEVAVLEFGEVSLSQRIFDFAQKAIAFDCQRIKLIPVFLSGGVHVREDIPQEITLAKQKLSNRIELELLDYVGNYPQLANLIAAKFATVKTSARILLAHGSRLSGGNTATENLAKKVQGINAYWTRQPDLTSAIELLVNQNSNITKIAIMPYFLFVGRITEEISDQVAILQKKFPQTKLLLTQPLGATPELAQMIVEKIIEPDRTR